VGRRFEPVWAHLCRKDKEIRKTTLRLVRKVLKSFNLSLYRFGLAEDLIQRVTEGKRINLRLLSIFPSLDSAELIKMLDVSKSQNGQDLFALMQNDFKCGGYFVEFGATNGISLSNTFLLESRYGWSGILAEPAKAYHKELLEQRNCIIDKRAVYSKSGKSLQFNEVNSLSLSTLLEFSESDSWADMRTHGKIYSVETISLNDLLKTHKAPYEIDFLSIDTEGSEFEILSTFDFREHVFRVICVEHNYSENRQRIFELLTREGYKRVLEELSMADDWYTKT
jgi:FkbM family methyltransferase